MLTSFKVSLRPRRNLLLGLCLLVAAFAVAQAPPSGDTYVSSTAPATNNGSGIVLIVGARTMSYVQFNLSGFPNGAAVSKAVLRLYLDAVATAGTFDVYQVNGAWKESSLTYNTQPPIGPSATGGNPISITAKSVNQFYLIDITNLVQGWLNGSIPNNGVELALTSLAGTFSFDSKESVLTGNGPELEITLRGQQGSGINSVTAGDGSIAIGGTALAPTVAVANAGITASKLASGTTVRSINGQTDALTLSGTNGLTVSGSGASLMVTSSATDSNVANTIVARDGSGNFTAGSITASNLSLPLTTRNIIDLSTAGVLTVGGQPFLHSFGTNSTFVGIGAGNLSVAGGGDNSAFGAFALNSISGGGSGNSSFGSSSLSRNDTGQSNSAFGNGALRSNTQGGQNSAFGESALGLQTTGGFNTAVGAHTLINLASGTFNTAVGFNAGSNHTLSDRYNLDFGNAGVAGDSNTIRIGDNNQSRAFMAGIATVPVNGSPVYINSEGQLGTGPQLQGPQGPPGPEGPQGPMGATGPQGPIGLTGPQGAQGATGSIGPMGLTGLQGPLGTTGPQGPAGLGFTLREAFNNSVSYAVNDVVSYNGSSYAATAPTNPGDPAPDVNVSWSLMAQQGAVGPQGLAGQQGATGAQGPAGAQGATGATGPQGPIGPTGPQGPQGVQGPIGPQGPQGPAGPQAPAGVGLREQRVALQRWYRQDFAVGGGGGIQLAFDGTNIWIPNPSGNNVIKVSASDGSVVGTYSVGTSPQAAVFDGTNVWVSNNLSNNVTKLLASNGTTMGTYAVGTNPTGMAFDGANVWVANSNAGTVTALAASNGTPVRTLSGLTSPYMLAFDGTYIWATSSTSNVVYRYRADTLACVTPCNIAIGAVNQRGIAYDGWYIWLTGTNSPTIYRLVASTGSAINAFGPVPPTNFAGSAGVTFDGYSVWVTNNTANVLFRYAAIVGNNTPTVQTTYSTGPGAFGVVSDGTNLWVSNTDGTVSRY